MRFCASSCDDGDGVSLHVSRLCRCDGINHHAESPHSIEGCQAASPTLNRNGMENSHILLWTVIPNALTSQGLLDKLKVDVSVLKHKHMQQQHQRIRAIFWDCEVQTV